jgi:hypothetical protein
MNAYEMADELLRDNTQLTVKAAYMLRQQADRIAELSKNVNELEEELLKTPQIKELSDEEIQSIWNEGIVGWYATQEESVLKFARAILKKTSEK